MKFTNSLRTSLYTTVGALLLTLSSFAQAPEKMSYQAVIRGANNALVTNQQVGMQISILQGSTAVYEETQTPTSNTNGLVSLEIGTGTVISGSFTAIDWSAGTYFIKTETDPTGGTNYTITGTSQLLSVPFALYAKTSGNGAGPIGPQGPAGNDGATGPIGADGAAGTNGTDGAQGIQGAQGDIGAAGADGAQGIQEADGATGATGQQGLAGNDGATGLTGPVGPVGPVGPAGPAGSLGPQGIQGAAGINGTPGIQGATGASGADGAAGAPGTAGAPGADGAAGTDGTQGIQGATGADGATGPSGTNGTQGIQGETGSVGTNGTQGETGAQGIQGETGAAGTNATQPIYTINTLYPELGGYVIAVRDGGKHGLVVAMQDQGSSNWYGANDLLSDANNHDVNGAKFMDWRLPTRRELNLMYGVYIGGNGANLNDYIYWSSTEHGYNNAWDQYFGNGDQYNGSKVYTDDVRAVRAF
jgi:hypothetical protein